MKFIYTLLIAFLVVTSGCKKVWTCTCTYEYTLGSTTFSTETVEESEKITKNDANVWCDQTKYEENGYSRSCELTK